MKSPSRVIQQSWNADCGGVFQGRFSETVFPQERWVETFWSLPQFISVDLGQSFEYPQPNPLKLMFRDARQPEKSRFFLSERVAEPFMRRSNV